MSLLLFKIWILGLVTFTVIHLSNGDKKYSPWEYVISIVLWPFALLYVGTRWALPFLTALKTDSWEPVKPKESVVCADCGSDDVSIEAFVCWSIPAQEYEVIGICDKGHSCNGCGREVSIDVKEIK